MGTDFLSLLCAFAALAAPLLLARYIVLRGERRKRRRDQRGD